MERIVLENFQSPGDIVMLTAAVRDLHRNFPGKFQVSPKTTAMQLWENNPHVNLSRNSVEIERTLVCQYPLIHQSNSGPWHFIHGFHQFIGKELGINLQPTEFRGDIHISDTELSWISQVQELTRMKIPFWIVNAGGKYDFTAKWWLPARYQEVIDSFAGKVLFVQVGEISHHHPPLSGVLDLRGKTDIRQLVRLVYHSQGVLAPVTLLMHLAAAVPSPFGPPGSRPCVVVAGGREPPQWEAYPTHQFLHTSGALDCCRVGGCWRSRVVPLGDGDEKDNPASLCLNVVNSVEGALSYSRTPLAAAPAHVQPTNISRNTTNYIPKCMDMITVDNVVRSIELYFSGGVAKYLNNEESKAATLAVERQVVR